jgi:hypothetical protein
MWQRLVSRKISWNFAVLGKVIRKRGRFMIFDPAGGNRLVDVICLTPITSKPRLTNPVLYRCVVWQVAYHRLHGFFGFWVERVTG